MRVLSVYKTYSSVSGRKQIGVSRVNCRQCKSHYAMAAGAHKPLADRARVWLGCSTTVGHEALKVYRP